MDSNARSRFIGKTAYSGALCGLIIVVVYKIALCSGQMPIGSDHMLYNIDKLSRSQNPSSKSQHSSSEEHSEGKPLYRNPGGSSRHPTSEEEERHPNRKSGGGLRVPSSEEEEKDKEEFQESRTNSESNEERRSGLSKENKNCSEEEIHEDDKFVPKTFDTKTFLNGVSILTGQPDPAHCENLDAWACNADQTKALCPNRCAKLGQAEDAPWCHKDKQEALCNHHDARWMCPSFCAAIDAKDCDLFEDWVCKSERAKKICPERCNNVNFTTDAPWCAQHGDNAGCNWLCMNPDANQMCSFFCLLHGYPLIGQNGLPTEIPLGLLNSISGLSELKRKYSGIQNIPGTQYVNSGTSQLPSVLKHSGIEDIPGTQYGNSRTSQLPSVLKHSGIEDIPGTQYGNSGTSQGIPGMGVYGHFMKLKNRQRILGDIPKQSGGLIGSIRGSLSGYQGPQAGNTGSQTEYIGPQTGNTGTQTGFIEPQTGDKEIPIGYSDSQVGNPGSQSGYPGTSPEEENGVQRLQGVQSGYPGSPIAYPGAGSQSGPNLGPDCSVGDVPGYPEVSPCELQVGIQVAYPEEGGYGQGLQTCCGSTGAEGDADLTESDGGVYGPAAYDTGTAGAYGTEVGGTYDTISSGVNETGGVNGPAAYDTGKDDAGGTKAGGTYDTISSGVNETGGVSGPAAYDTGKDGAGGTKAGGTYDTKSSGVNGTGYRDVYGTGSITWH